MAGSVPEEHVSRPMAQQTWRQVSMLHWRIDPRDLEPLLPSRLQPDIVDGSAWISIVAFRVADFRLFGLPAARGTFPETNLRTYVHDRFGRDGIWFLSLDVPSILNTVGGRLIGIPYHVSLMSTTCGEGVVRYRARRRGRRQVTHDIVIEPGGPTGALSRDVAESLAGRWRAFSRVGGLVEVPVEHEAWALEGAHLERLDESLFHAAGLVRPSADPAVYYADGLHARLGRPRRVRLPTGRDRWDSPSEGASP
jgi:uncharacterized protein YqjF (DUF2071 family)